MRAWDRAARRLERISVAWPMALLLGASLAFALYAMPGVWLGRAIAGLGLGGLLPLGAGARLPIALLGGAAGAGGVWALFRRLERPVHGRDMTDGVDERLAWGEAFVTAEAPAPLMAVTPILPAMVEEVAVPPETAIPDPAPAAHDAAPPEDAACDDVLPAKASPRKPLPRWSPRTWLRARRRADADGVPMLRRADAHPDAPSRRPIFAAADLGAPLDTVAPGWLPDPRWSVADRDDADAGAAPAPLLLGPEWQAFEPASPLPLPGVARRPVAASAPVAVPEQASVAALMARLEAALAERPDYPAAPPKVGAAFKEAMRELRRPGDYR